MSNDRSCADCEGEMREIRLIDKSHAELHKPLEYAAADSKKGWFGRYSIAGNVNAFRCQQCGVIRLSGVPCD